MKVFFVLSILFISCTILSGCGNTTIDASSQETFDNSIQKMKKPLSEEKKKELEQAITYISMDSVSNIFEASINADGIKRKIRDKLDGKTAQEIIDEGNKILIKQMRPKEEEILQEIKELEDGLIMVKEKRDDPKAEFTEEDKRMLPKIEERLNSLKKIAALLENDKENA